jgi:hypothetical protein
MAIRRLLDYIADLTAGSLMLWCYLIWYLIVLVRYFDPSPRLWLTSVGLSLVIGFALLVSTTAAGGNSVKLARWQMLRLFLTPFCVSSFSALVRGKGFVLVFSPRRAELFAAVLFWTALCFLVFAVKRSRREVSRQPVGFNFTRSTKR